MKTTARKLTSLALSGVLVCTGATGIVVADACAPDGANVIQPAYAATDLQIGKSYTFSTTRDGREFQFKMPASGCCWLETTPLDGDDFEVEIWANEKRYEDYTCRVGDGAIASNSYVFSPGTVVTIKTWKRYGWSSYSKFEAAVKTTSLGNQEREDNDSERSANAIELSKAKTGIVNCDDEDWYAFKAPYAGYYRFECTVTEGGADVYATKWQDETRGSSIRCEYGYGKRDSGTIALLKGERIHVCVSHGGYSETYAQYNLKMSFVEKAKPKAVKIKKAKALKGRTAVVKWSTRGGVDGYQIRYSKNKKFPKKKTKKVLVEDGDYNSCEIGTERQTLTLIGRFGQGGLTPKKKYYVQVRTYREVAGKTFYSSWSKRKAFKARR